MQSFVKIPAKTHKYAFLIANLIKICYNKYTWWCSILVKHQNIESGDKISLKGISMKFLVLPSVAQTRGCAGS